MSDQREKILNEACGLYLSEGLDGFSMRKLAKAVGVTAPALYKYYDSREAVLLDVLSHGYRLLAQGLYESLAAGSAWDRFRRAGEAHLDFALDQRRYYELIYTHPKHLGIEDFPAEIEAQGCAIHQFFMDRVRECMSAGLLRTEDPEEAAITLWGHAHGLISLFLGGMMTAPDGRVLTEEEFRAVYMQSGRRLLRGMAEPDFAAGLDEELAATRVTTARRVGTTGGGSTPSGRDGAESPDDDERVVA